MITIYTTATCPRCKVLKMKLDQKGIAYEECLDEAKMQEMGIESVPAMAVDGLSVDGELLDFAAAIKYVNER